MAKARNYSKMFTIRSLWSEHLTSTYILIGIIFLLLLFMVFYVLRRYCDMNIVDEVVLQPQENGLRNHRRQDFNRCASNLSNYNRSFTLNNQRQQESDHFVAIQIDSLNHQLLHGNDFPPTYEDALRQDKKIQEKPPEYLEFYI